MLLALHAASQTRFDPRTRVGCDGGSQNGYTWMGCFDPRTRVGCDSSSLTLILRRQRFDPRTRVGCDAIQVSTGSSLCTFRSTHPRGVRPAGAESPLLINLVSIHAPAWGATSRVPRRCRIRFRVSIHAPAWGATRRAGHDGPGGNGFDPRTRVGCDGSASRWRSTAGCFDPRTRVGCDQPPCARV